MPRRRPRLMSNNLNDPAASRHTPNESTHETADRLVREILDSSTTSDAEISPSGELYRAIERFHRLRRTEAQSGILARPLPPSMSSEQEADSRRRSHREATEPSPLFVLPQQTTSPEPTLRERNLARSIGLARRGGRQQRGDFIGVARRGRQQRGNVERHRPSTGDDSGLVQAGRQLATASASLRSLLDDPIPSILPPPHDPSDWPSDTEHGRGAKRRKLDTDKLDSSFAGFSYGKYGQVEPGKLKMEIVSCDGGIYKEERGQTGLEDYSAENVLKTDNSVYCTKSNRCNLVLRHQGSTVFCLKELVIKAPHHGYTAPIQEGMVFISMTSDDLLTRTAQYQIQYSPSRSRHSEPSHTNELPPIMSIRHNGDGTMTTAQARARRLYDIGLQDEECDFRTAQIPLDFTASAPPFQVTTDFSDSEDEESSRPSVSRIREMRRNAGLRGLRFVGSDVSSSGDEDGDDNNTWEPESLNGLSPLRRRETASNITLAEAAEASQVATQEAVRAVGGELMVPHARFFIERDKSRCTVRFDPPVSGRFILLKMWSPQHSPGGNIDIQSVVAKGFAGPRYFPAITLR